MTRTRSLLAVLAVVVILTLSAGFGGSVAAQTAANNTTATATPTPTPTPSPTPTATPEPTFENPGPYDIQRLREPGQHIPLGPDSVRSIPGGQITVRIHPVGPFAPAWEYMKSDPETVVESDRLTLYSNRPAARSDVKLTLTIVYWELAEIPPEARNGTQRFYAENQTVQTVDLRLGENYALTNVSLQSHFDKPVRVTMWLSQDGQPIPGAQWTFTHHTNPTSQTVPIGSFGDLLEWVWWFVIVTGGISIYLGNRAGEWALKRAGAPPRYGYILWGIVLLLAGSFAVSAWFFELAVIITTAPQLVGVALGILTFALTLGNGNPVHELLFIRWDIANARPSHSLHDLHGGKAEAATDGGAEAMEMPEEASSIEDYQPPRSGDDSDLKPGQLKQSLYIQEEELPAVHTPDGYKIPKPGVKPFFARLFANAAILDESKIRANVEVTDGPHSRWIFTDPEKEYVVKHIPANLRFRPKIWLDEPEVNPSEFPQEEPEFSGYTAPIQRRLWKLNTTYVLRTAVAGALGAGAGLYFGLMPLAVILGAGAVYVSSLEATDGDLIWEPAPIHLSDVLATLTVLQRYYTRGRSLEETEERLWQQAASEDRKVREMLSRRDITLLEEALDIDIDGDMSASDLLDVDGSDPFDRREDNDGDD